jgi:hypothetical protein
MLTKYVTLFIHDFEYKPYETNPALDIRHKYSHESSQHLFTSLCIGIYQMFQKHGGPLPWQCHSAFVYGK